MGCERLPAWGSDTEVAFDSKIQELVYLRARATCEGDHNRSRELSQEIDRVREEWDEVLYQQQMIAVREKGGLRS